MAEPGQPIAEWANSPDRAVAVLAGPGGLPLDVRLSPEALRQSPDVLAHLVLATATLAGRQATRRLHRRLTETIGPAASRTLDQAGLAATPDEPGSGPRGDEDGFGDIMARPY